MKVAHRAIVSSFAFTGESGIVPLTCPCAKDICFILFWAGAVQLVPPHRAFYRIASIDCFVKILDLLLFYLILIGNRLLSLVKVLIELLAYE